MMKWCIVLFIFFCSSCSTEVNQTLKSASDNKMDLYKVLMHYRFVDRDSEKYNAALFLIENMKYHYSKGKIPHDNLSLKQWHIETDSIYYSVLGDSIPTNTHWNSLRKIQKIRNKELDSIIMPKVDSNTDLYIDCQYLSSKFIIEHIDNAFKVWKASKFARHLSFDEFKEYILPYRSIKGCGYHINGSEYNNLFAKYVFSDTTSSLRTHLARYNNVIYGAQILNGPILKKYIGTVYDKYVFRHNDCVQIATYGCDVFRACGIPAVVEYNICFRDLVGRHFYCNAYDTNRMWKSFDPGDKGIVPYEKIWEGKNTLNIYRDLYGAQKQTPFFLRNRDEYIPQQLSSPCIKDVTSYTQKTVAIELPFSIKTSNRVAYLGTFNKGYNGFIPVTWGEINSLSNKVKFENVMPNILYFPIYYPDKDLEVFGEPFYVKLDSSGGFSLLPIPGTSSCQDSLVTLLINRKFPRKPNMLNVARKMIGGHFLGANKQDFSDAKVLYEIKEAPKPYFFNYPLKNKKAYQYYRFQTIAEYPHSEISMLEWITHKNFNYTNTMTASRPHIVTPDDESVLENESKYVKLLDAKSWDDMKRKIEYDGNMQTAPTAYSVIPFSLKKPQVVTDVRFSPRNADNGITAGDEFEIYYWNDGWQYGGDCKAEYEYVSFDNIPANKLYWLVNKTRGKEELIFTMIDGKQSFLYYDMLNE